MITTTSPRTFRWDRGLTAMLHRTRVRLTSWVRGTFAFFSLSDRRAAQECQRSIFVAICICAFSSLSTNQRPRFSPPSRGGSRARFKFDESRVSPPLRLGRLDGARPGHSRGRGRADARTPPSAPSQAHHGGRRRGRAGVPDVRLRPLRRVGGGEAVPRHPPPVRRSADELALSWDAFRSSNAMKVSANPTAAAMEAFRSHFERYVASKRKTSAVKTPQAFYYDKPNLLEALESGDVDTDMVDASRAAITPGRGGNTPGAKTSAARAAHAQAIRGLGVQLPRADASESLAAARARPRRLRLCQAPRPPARSRPSSTRTSPRPSAPRRGQDRDRARARRRRAHPRRALHARSHLRQG